MVRITAAPVSRRDLDGDEIDDDDDDLIDDDDDDLDEDDDE
jgi:hypothetical protein